MHVAIVLGTRPEIIKTSPILRFLNRNNKHSYTLIHTGQHYSTNMDELFFQDLELAPPSINLKLGSKPFNMQIGFLVQSLRAWLDTHNPDIILVQGDTVSVLAASLAGSSCGVPVAHHEAGLRSGDYTMPEEVNRIITDHISSVLCFPTQSAMEAFTKEKGGYNQLVSVTGNTIVDAVQQNLHIAKKSTPTIQQKLHLTGSQYFLWTFHRAENVDHKSILINILQAIEETLLRYPSYSQVISLHPRTKKRMSEFSLALPKEVIVTEPLGYLDFLLLEAEAKIIITDSGGLQEEASILKVPCVTIRENTERPETITHGYNILAGTQPKKIIECIELMKEKELSQVSLYGEGNASQNIIEALEKYIQR